MNNTAIELAIKEICDENELDFEDFILVTYDFDKE